MAEIEEPALEAVTFDYWNTLCHEPPSGYLRGRRLEAMTAVLVDAGVGDAGDQLAVGYDAVWLSYVESWQRNVQFTGADAARHIADHVEALYATGPAVRQALLEAFASFDAELI